MQYFEDEAYWEIKNRKSAVKQARQQTSILANYNDSVDYNF
jgi:hypothetical protein